MPIQIELPALHPIQLQILTKLQTYQYVMANTGRRFGKSTVAWFWLLSRIQQPGHRAAFISASYRQTMTIYLEIVQAISKTGIILNKTKSPAYLEFTNGSYIKFYTAGSLEQVRGEAFSTIVCDEFALYDPDDWATIIQPTMATDPQSKALLISTPRGRGWYFDLWQKANNARYYRWSTITATTYDNPYISRDWIEDIRHQIPTKIFQQEYLAEFIDTGGQLFEGITNCIRSDGQYGGHQVYIGIDIGFMHDQTALVVIDQHLKCLEFFTSSDQHKDYQQMATALATIIRRYPKRQVVVETNKYDSVPTLLKRMGINLIEWTTTAQNKKSIIEALAQSIKTEQIQLLNEPELLNQLYNYGYTINQHGHYQFGATKGHDDLVMALAMAHWQAINPKPAITKIATW
jgi:phage terminase large subunit-like protein